MAKRAKKHSFGSVMKSKYGGFIVIFIIFIVLLCVYPGNNLFTWIAAKREIRTQERQMRNYQLEIMQMQDRIEALTDDKDSLERFAREKFHFTEEGEDVYLVEEK